MRLAVPRVTTAAFQLRGRIRVSGRPIKASQLIAIVKAIRRRLRRRGDSTRTASMRKRPLSSLKDSSIQNLWRYQATAAESVGSVVARYHGSSGAAAGLRDASAGLVRQETPTLSQISVGRR